MSGVWDRVCLRPLDNWLANHDVWRHLFCGWAPWRIDASGHAAVGGLVLNLRRCLSAGLLAWAGLAAALSGTADSGADRLWAQRIEAGQAFLTNLFDPELELLPEYPGAKVYWLYHDNYLAAQLLEGPRPDLARRIRAALARYGVSRSGKIELLFGEPGAELPFRIQVLTNVARIGPKLIRTERAGERLLPDWAEYADLLLLAAVARAKDAPAQAGQHLAAALKLWDGRGFYDRATRASGLYATYKLALALTAAQRLRADLPMRSELLDRLARLQSPAGGWITDYTDQGQPRGLANVETTCLVLLALQGEPGR